MVVDVVAGNTVQLSLPDREHLGNCPVIYRPDEGSGLVLLGNRSIAVIQVKADGP